MALVLSGGLTMKGRPDASIWDQVEAFLRRYTALLAALGVVVAAVTLYFPYADRADRLASEERNARVTNISKFMEPRFSNMERSIETLKVDVATLKGQVSVLTIRQTAELPAPQLKTQLAQLGGALKNAPAAAVSPSVLREVQGKLVTIDTLVPGYWDVAGRVVSAQSQQLFWHSTVAFGVGAPN